MKPRCIAILLCLLPLASFGQSVAVKSNLLHDAATTLNLGAEVRLSGRMTLDVPVSYNPWEGDRQFQLLMAQPELRYWFCESFNGAFVGLHGHLGEYDVQNVKLPFDAYPALKQWRYSGTFYGGGLSLGYQWVLGNRWGLEVALGGGYARMDYERYTCGDCSDTKSSHTEDYWGLTRASLTLSFMIF